MLDPLFAGAGAEHLRRTGLPLPSEAKPRRLRALVLRIDFENWGGSRTDQHECLERCAKALEYMQRSVNQILSRAQRERGDHEGEIIYHRDTEVTEFRKI